MARKKYGLSFSWKRATGLSAAKGKLSRQIGIPLTKSGRQRKAGKAMGCMIPLLIILLCILYLASSFAQSPDLQTKIKGFKNSKRFNVKYDKFKDLTIVSVGTFNIGSTGNYIISGDMYGLSAYFGFKGTKTRPPDNFYLAFDHTGKEWRFLQSRELYLLIDGERERISNGNHDGKVRRGVSERLLFEIPSGTFSKIASAKTVELQVGGFEMSLKDEHLQAFRDLLSLTK
jgi:hypothetical protein